MSPTTAAAGGLGGAGGLQLELDAQHAVAVGLQRHPAHDGRRAWLEGRVRVGASASVRVSFRVRVRVSLVGEG